MTHETQQRLGRWLAVLLAFILPLGAMLLPPMLAGQFWATGDGLTQNFPHRVMAALALGAGIFPFWNPFAFGGVPFFATIQPGLLFPGNWPFLFLPPVVAQNAMVAIAQLGAGLGLYAFARVLGQTRLAAVLAGLAYMLGGFVTMHVEHIQMIQVAGLSPWLLLSIERFAQTAHGRYALAAACLVAAAVLAGSPQITAYALLLAVLYALFRALALPVAERLVFLAQGLVAAAVGVALSAVQWVPMLDLIGSTQRGALGPYTFGFASLPPTGLLGLFAPYAFGARAPGGLVSTPFWGVPDWQGALDGYVGTATLLLAAIALGLAFNLEKAARPLRLQVMFWVAVGLVGTLLTLGTFTPLGHMVAALPVLNTMRYPHRHFFEATLAISLLAGFGLSWLQATLSPAEALLRRRALAVAIGGAGFAALLLLGLVFFRGTHYAARLQPYMPPEILMGQALSPATTGFWLPGLLIALAAALAVWQHRLAGLLGDQTLDETVTAAEAPSRAPKFVRLLPALLLTGLVNGDLLAYGRLQGLTFILPRSPTHTVSAPWPNRAQGRELTVPLAAMRYPNCADCDVLGYLERFHYPGVSTLLGLATVNGYDAFLPARYGKLLGMDSFGHAGEYSGALWETRHHALDLLDCRTVRLATPLLAQEGNWEARLASGRWQRLPDTEGFVRLRNPRALGSAWRVTRARALMPATVDAAVAGRVPFDPASEALLDVPALPFGELAPGSADSTWTTANHLRLDTRGDGPGLVVVSEGFDPGWRARLVQGEGAPRDLPVMRADALLLAVAVPAGDCRVELTYAPRRWGLGLAGTGLGILGLALWAMGLGLTRRRRSQAQQVPEPDGVPPLALPEPVHLPGYLPRVAAWLALGLCLALYPLYLVGSILTSQVNAVRAAGVFAGLGALATGIACALALLTYLLPIAWQGRLLPLWRGALLAAAPAAMAAVGLAVFFLSAPLAPTWVQVAVGVVCLATWLRWRSLPEAMRAFSARALAVLLCAPVVGLMAFFPFFAFRWANDRPYLANRPTVSPNAATLPKPPRRIVLLTFDSLRARTTTLHDPNSPNTPNLAAFASEGTTLERFRAAGDTTRVCTPALLAGVAPPRLYAGVRHMSGALRRGRYQSLGAHLRQAGYRTYAATMLVSPDVLAVSEDFDETSFLYRYLSIPTFNTEAYFPFSGVKTWLTSKIDPVYVPDSRDVLAATRETWETALAYYQRPDERAFMWVHLAPPHSPYWPLPTTEPPTAKGMKGIRADTEQADLTPFEAAYQTYTRFGDAEFGRFVAALKRDPLWAETLFIVTSDHGEEFLPHLDLHGNGVLTEDVTHVPGVIHLPGQTQPRRISQPTSQLDMAPTVLGQVFTTIPAGFDGANLFAPQPAPPDRPVFTWGLYVQIVEGAKRPCNVAAYQGRWKYVRALPSPVEQLYDLERDPAAKVDVLAENPAVAARLRQAMDGYLALPKKGR